MSSFVGSNQFPISTAHHTPLTLFYHKKFISSGAEWKIKVTENKIFSCFTISNFPHLCMGKIIRSIIKIGGGRGDVMIQWRSKPPLMEYSEEARMMRLLANRKKSQIYEIMDLWSLSLINLHDNVVRKSKKESNIWNEKTECVDSWKIQMHEMKHPINYEKCHIHRIVDLGNISMVLLRHWVWDEAFGGSQKISACSNCQVSATINRMHFPRFVFFHFCTGGNFLKLFFPPHSLSRSITGNIFKQIGGIFKSSLLQKSYLFVCIGGCDCDCWYIALPLLVCSFTIFHKAH